MKIKLLQIGKTDDGYVTAGVEKYLSRLKHYITFETETLPDYKAGKKPEPEVQKREEAKMLLAKIEPGDIVILLDENGKSFSSEEFAGFVQKKLAGGGKRIIFIIGGPFGFAEEIYKNFPEKIALSKMTFSHQMVRLFFIEQVYRAFTIMKGEKYHH